MQRCIQLTWIVTEHWLSSNETNKQTIKKKQTNSNEWRWCRGTSCCSPTTNAEGHEFCFYINGWEVVFWWNKKKLYAPAVCNRVRCGVCTVRACMCLQFVYVSLCVCECGERIHLKSSTYPKERKKKETVCCPRQFFSWLQTGCNIEFESMLTIQRKKMKPLIL